MAEPVIVPIQLEVTDVDMSGANFADASKQIAKSLTSVKKSVQDVFNGIDPSAINKSIGKSMAKVEKGVQKYEKAYDGLESAVRRAGESTKEYQNALADLDYDIDATTKRLAAIDKSLDENARAYQRNVAMKAQAERDLAANPQDLSAQARLKEAEYMIDISKKRGLADAENGKRELARLQALKEERKALDPADFVDKAAPSQIEKIAAAYKNVLSVQEDLNKNTEEFNRTAKDNQASDEYNDLTKQAEAYKKKLEDLNEKSKKMEFTGATDKQWENLRQEVEWTSLKMDEVIKKMRTSVRNGKAFRFGEGPRGEFSNQINGFAMSKRNNARYATERAMANQSPFTTEYQQALDELDKLEKKIEAIREKSAKMLELGASDKQFAALVYEAEQLDVKVDEVKNHLIGMANSGAAFKSGSGNAAGEIEKIRDRSNSLQSTLTGVAQNARVAQGGLTALGATHPKLAAILSVAGKIAVGFSKVASVTGKVVTGIVKGFTTAVKVVRNVASSIGRVASGFMNAGKRILGCIKHLNIFGKIGNSTTKSMGSRIKKLTKNFLMFGLGFRTVYYAVRRLRNIFIESFQLMGEKFEEVGQPIASFVETLNRLKGSLATAFQPLVNVVIPYLNKFMNYLSDTLEKVGKFMATLTGQGHIYKAVAKNINSVASAAKNANKELGSYDKLEVIKQDDTGYDYEQQGISATEDAASSFASMVKKAWENADFTGVGQFVTQKLLEVLDIVEKTFAPKVIDFVNRLWTSVNTFFDGFDATAIGEKVGSIINTLVTGIKWDQFGAMLGNLYSEIFDFILGLATEIDWAAVGQALASAVNAMFKALDLAEIGTTISILFNRLMVVIANFFRTVDWAGIATAFSEGINNIFSGDSSAFWSATNALNDAITTIVSIAIETINWEKIFDTLNGALEHLFKSAGKSLASTDNPLLQSVGSVFTAIGEAASMLGPMTKDVVKTLMPLVSVILTQIGTMLPGIVEFTAKFTSVVLPVLAAILEAMLPTLTDVVMNMLPLLMDLLVALEPVFAVIVADVLPQAVRLTKSVTEVIFKVLGLIVSILVPLLPTIAKLLEIVCTVVDVILTLLEPLFSIIGTLCDVLGQILQPILEALIPVFDLVNALVRMLAPLIKIALMPLQMLADIFKVIAGIVTAFMVPALNVLTFVIGLVATKYKSVADVITVAFATIKDLFAGLWNSVKPGVNAFLWGIEALANGVIRGINTMVKALNNLSFDVPDWVPGMGGKKFGFNLREVKEIKIPRLAQGAVIPPNREFLAMLGDQKHGTNIEAPLDTIKQALAEVLAEVGNAGNKQPIVLQVNGRTLAQVVWDEQEKRYKQTGKAMA